MFKQVALAFFIVFLFSVFVACGGNSDDDDSPSPSKNDNPGDGGSAPPTFSLTRTVRDHLSEIKAVAFSADSSKFVSGAVQSMGKEVILWNASTGAKIAEYDHSRDVTAIDFSADGKIILGDGTGDVYILSADLSSVIRSGTVHTAGTAVNAIAMGVVGGVDETTIATGGADNQTVFAGESLGGGWCDRNHGNVVRALDTGSANPTTQYHAAFAHDGTHDILIWRSGHCVPPSPSFKMSGHTATVVSLDYGAFGTLLASAASDQTIRIWNALNGEQVALKRSATAGVNYSSVAMSGDGRQVAGAGFPNRLDIYDVAGDRVQSFTPGVSAASVAFSPDGSKIAFSEGTNTAIHLYSE